MKLPSARTAWSGVAKDEPSHAYTHSFHLQDRKFTRRDMLTSSVVAGGAMMLGYSIEPTALAASPKNSWFETAAAFSDGSVRISVHGDGKVGSEGLELSELKLDDVSILDEMSAAQSANLASTATPGRVNGSGKVVSSLTEASTQGVLYLLSYTVLEDHSGSSNLYFGQNGPFSNRPLPTAPGPHALLLVADFADDRSLMRISGDITFAELSLRKAEWSMNVAQAHAGKKLSWRVGAGQSHVDGMTYIPEAGVWYVSPVGSDMSGSGALLSPLRQPAQASELSQPGDTIYLRPGVYAPFEVSRSGAENNPITFTTLPGEERQAVISGADAGLRRGGIEVRAKDYIHIRNLTIEDAALNGIFVEGVEGEVHGHHIISGNLTRRTGNSGVLVCGFLPVTRLPMVETEVLRTVDVIIEHNDISLTNVANEFTSGYTESDGSAGGKNEAISVASAAGDIVTRFNDVHDSRQYGIDYKGGVRGGAIHDNRIWNMDRYGIYLDTGRRFIDDIAVYNNHVWNCRSGITLSREADYEEGTDDFGAPFGQRFRNIDIFNNVFRDINTVGIYCQGHPGDAPVGEISNVRIRFNTVYNAGRDGAGREVRLSEWADPDWIDAGVVSGFEFVGNVVWRSDGATDVLDEFSGQLGFLVADNLVGVDPLFVAPNAEEPDFRLQVGSPAYSISGVPYAGQPFEHTIEGLLRSAAGSIGAF